MSVFNAPLALGVTCRLILLESFSKHRNKEATSFQTLQYFLLIISGKQDKATFSLQYEKTHHRICKAVQMNNKIIQTNATLGKNIAKILCKLNCRFLEK